MSWMLLIGGSDLPGDALMPIGMARGLDADAIPSRPRVDPWTWCVRVALLVLVSPALLLVLVLGGLFLVAQAASRGLGLLSGPSRPDRSTRSLDLAPGMTATSTVRRGKSA
jgi:hypothetical protein